MWKYRRQLRFVTGKVKASNLAELRAQRQPSSWSSDPADNAAIGPHAADRLRNTARPGDVSRGLAPTTVTDRGENSLSRRYVDMGESDQLREEMLGGTRYLCYAMTNNLSHHALAPTRPCAAAISSEVRVIPTSGIDRHPKPSTRSAHHSSSDIRAENRSS
jgi:hypothetical protein